MLTTFKNYTFKAKIVNTVKAASIVFLLGMSSTAYADMLSTPSVFSVSEKIQVVIKVSDLTAPSGAENVYDILSTEALAACTPDYMKFSTRLIDSCTEDLMDQFIDDLDVPAVTKIHNAPDA